MKMDTTQIKGVDSTKRITRAELMKDARLVIREKLMTHGEQTAETDFSVDLTGEDSGCDLVSRRSRAAAPTRCSARSSTAIPAAPGIPPATRSSWTRGRSARSPS